MARKKSRSRRPPSGTRQSPQSRSSARPARSPRRARTARKAKPHSEFELKNEEIETALQTGEHAGLLEDYFGPEEYAELLQLSREAAARGVRGGPKVLILPGIMGSKIGRRFGPSIFDDVYWFDPIDIGLGRLSELTLRPGDRLEALGVMLITYLKLKLRLRIAGYDAEFYAFDWRRSIAELGRRLVRDLQKRKRDPVNIVAHSMGGLVARWALGNGGECRRLIMLGTPNYGSFTPLMVFRATYPIVRKVAALDLKHSAEELARDVFTTFPGLAQMLPSPERFRDLDLYDLANWPDDELHPRRETLSGVEAVRRQLAKGPKDFFVIAGVDRATVSAVQKHETEAFLYEFSQAGDGTVPVELVKLPDVTTYFTPESHGSMPNNKVVTRAVLDLLDRGETDALPRTYPEQERRSEVRRVPERELRTDPYPARRSVQLSKRELRNMLEEVAAPVAHDEVPVPAATGPGPLAGTEAVEPGYRHPFDRVVVGRRRQHRLDLRFAFGSITEADARALALGIFRDVAPSGAARALDIRLRGAITELTHRRMFSGNVGEIFMLPTGFHPVRAELIAFVGLGPFDRFSDEVLQTAAENVIRTFVNTRVEEFATVPFGAGSGESAAGALRNLLAGFIRGLLDADKDHHFRRIVICEQNRQRYTELKEELYRLSSTPLCQDVELTFDETTLEAGPETRALPPRLERRREDPVYLIVRQEQRAARTGRRGTRTAEFDVRSSVLTAGAKATVVTGVQEVKRRVFEAVRDRLVDPDVTDLAADGDRLARMLLAEEVRAVLPRQPERHLVVVHDAPLSQVPWETIAFTGANGRDRPWMPAASKGLSHRYAADNLSVAKWLEERVADDVLNVLLIVNPTLDLDGADAEGERVRQLFKDVPGCRIDALEREAATRPSVLAAFGSGKYDVIHYAGHAFFDPTSPERSGILCHGRVELTGADLAGLGNLPTLVFFNACESGRLRRGSARGRRSRPAERNDRSGVLRVREAVGLAEAFMRGGVANFLGTYWPVGDAAAKLFATAFYTEIMSGATLGDAVQEGRSRVRRSGSKDWADYMFYGNPDFILKEALVR